MYRTDVLTGVMPVTWSCAFSSLNTAEDLAHDPDYHNALVFESSDIEELLALRFPAVGPDQHAKRFASICK